MKQKNLRRWVVLAALGAHVFAPAAAYASAKANDSFGDLCSAFGKATTLPISPVGLPTQRADRHGADHCAYCVGASADAAIISPALVTTQTQAPAMVARPEERVAPTSLFLLLPPSRAPPIAA